MADKLVPNAWMVRTVEQLGIDNDVARSIAFGFQEGRDAFAAAAAQSDANMAAVMKAAGPNWDPLGAVRGWPYR